MKIQQLLHKHRNHQLITHLKIIVIVSHCAIIYSIKTSPTIYLDRDIIMPRLPDLTIVHLFLIWCKQRKSTFSVVVLHFVVGFYRGKLDFRITTLSCFYELLPFLGFNFILAVLYTLIVQWHFFYCYGVESN